MAKRSVEYSVGVFLLIGLICIGYLTIRLGKMEIVGGNYYKIKARFSSVAGLKKGATVEISGVQVGKVDSIQLDPEDSVAVVTMKIDGKVKISDDANASIKTSGLIGDKYISIVPGGSGTNLAPGDQITETSSGVDIEEVIGKYAFGNVGSAGGTPQASAGLSTSASQPSSSPQEKELQP